MSICFISKRPTGLRRRRGSCRQKFWAECKESNNLFNWRINKKKQDQDLTEMIISCSPVAVQFGVQLDILTVQLNSLCVKVYRVTNLFSCEFFVTFFLIDFCYRWKSKTDLIRNLFRAEHRYSIRVIILWRFFADKISNVNTSMFC